MAAPPPGVVLEVQVVDGRARVAHVADELPADTCAPSP